jgi:aromatic ring hydroxylase
VPRLEFGKRPPINHVIKDFNAQNREIKGRVDALAVMRKRESMRKRAIAEYGCRCDACGYDKIEALTFDQVKVGGNQFKKKYGHGFVKWLHINKFPNTVRLLCYNCAALKAHGIKV